MRFLRAFVRGALNAVPGAPTEEHLEFLGFYIVCLGYATCTIAALSAFILAFLY